MPLRLTSMQTLDAQAWASPWLERLHTCRRVPRLCGLSAASVTGGGARPEGLRPGRVSCGVDVWPFAVMNCGCE